MGRILKLWWKDHQETWKFAKKHPFIFTGLMLIVFLILRMIGL